MQLSPLCISHISNREVQYVELQQTPLLLRDQIPACAIRAVRVRSGRAVQGYSGADERVKAHSMIQNLCDLGLAEKQKYGAVHLTEQGSEEAARYSLGCAQLSEKLKAALGLSEDVCSHIACTVLAELPEQLAVLSE